jgi:hypothetical protein
LKVPLLKGSAKDLILKCILIYLALDVRFYIWEFILKDNVGAERAIEKYKDEDPSFDGSRECIFSTVRI